MQTYKVIKQDDIVTIEIEKYNARIKLQKISDGLYNAFTTQVDQNFRDQGHGTEVLECVIDWASKNKYKFRATCPFVIAQAKKLNVDKKIYLR